MPKGNRPADRNKQKIKKLPMSNSQKAEHFTKALSEQIANCIEKGDVSVSPKKRCIEKQPKSQQIASNMPLEAIDQTLKSLRQHIREQKQEQKQYQKIKLLKAHELIVKLKKEKEDQKKKLLEKEEKSILHSRIFSESTLTKMRLKLEQRVQDKRREIEERIKSIAVRKTERDHRMFQQQIQYWQRIKAVEQKSQSAHNLPSLNPEISVKRNSVGVIPRKNSLAFEQKGEPQNAPYSKQIDLYLQKIKVKERSVDFKQSERKSSQRLNKIIASNQKLANALSPNNPSNNQFLPDNFYNKSKLYGNQYLKESLLKVKKKVVSPIENTSPVQNQTESLQESIELKARQVAFHKNGNVEKLKEKWARVLSRIEHRQVSQEQGLELLNSIQRRLDKVDLGGMTDRLTRKATVFQREKNSQMEVSEERQMEPPTPSFEGKE